MVTGTVLQWLASALSALLGVFPRPTLPGWFGAVPSWLPDAIGQANKMGSWFPLDAIRNSVALLLLLWGVALAIRIARIVLSFLTMGGGSAA